MHSEGNDDALTAEAVLSDPAASRTLKTVLRAWMVRDPVDAANDAECLARVLGRGAMERMKKDDGPSANA